MTTTTIKTKKLFNYRINDTDLIYDCQFYNNDLVGISTIEGDIKLIKFDIKNNDENNIDVKIINEWNGYHNHHPIRKIRFHENLLFSISKSIKITDLETKKLLRKISNGSKKIYSIKIIDNYLFCIGDDYGNFKCWDYRCNDNDGDKIYFSNNNSNSNHISDIDIDNNRKLIYTTTGNGQLFVYNIRAKRLELPVSEQYETGFQSIRYLSKKNKIIVGCEDGVLNIFNNNDNEWGNISDRYPIHKNNQGEYSIDCMEIINHDDDNDNDDIDDDFIVIGTSNGTIEIVSLFPHKFHQIMFENSNKSNIEAIHINNDKIININDNELNLFKYRFIKSNDNDDKQNQNRIQTQEQNDNYMEFFDDLIQK